MSKGAIGLLSAYWPENTARYAHVPLERVTQSCVLAHASSVPDAPALVAGDRSVTFSQLAEMVGAVSAGLRERVAEGGRVAITADEPLDQVLCLLGCLAADVLAYVVPPGSGSAELAAFEPDLVVAAEPAAERETVDPGALLAGAGGPATGRANLRTPVLALAKPGGGEALHNHKTLVGTAISMASFFILDAGARVVLLEPPAGWLGVAALLGTLHRGGSVRLGWGAAQVGGHGEVDYAVASWDVLEERYAAATPRLRDVHARAGVLAGVDGPFNVGRRRRLSRRLGAPLLTVFGRNDLGPVLASHPTWFLDAAVGIPLPNVDLRPLNPADGAELAIGWDSVEEAELGVKSALAPAGGELSGSWLRTRLVGSVDPTGLYFFTRVGAPGDSPSRS